MASGAGHGIAGERHARLWLEAKGYTLLDANWRCADGELDLVMRDGTEIVFVEVKTRTGTRFGHAVEAVTDAKARRVLTAADAWIAAHPEHDRTIWRGDIVAVTLGAGGTVRSVEHYVDAIHED